MIWLQILGFGIGFFGVTWLFKWSLDKDLVITFDPFSIKIVKR